MKEILFNYLVQYIEFCKVMFIYDMDVFSQGWIYAWVLVPAFFYFIFFLLKWVVITMPLWIPFRVMMKGPLFPFVKMIENKAKKRKKELEILKDLTK